MSREAPLFLDEGADSLRRLMRFLTLLSAEMTRPMYWIACFNIKRGQVFTICTQYLERTVL